MRHALVLWAAVAAAAPAAAADLPEMEKRGTLRVLAATGEQPEMFSWKPGGDPGFEREMIDGFAQLHKLKVEAVAVKTYDERIPALVRSDGDLVIGMIVTEERRKKIDFTVEVLPARHLVITHKPHKVVNAVEEFRAEKVGVLKGSTWAQAALDAGATAPESFNEVDQLLEALRAGKVTATVMSISDFTLAAKRYPGLQGGVFVGAPGSAAWGIRKEDLKLKAALDEYLEAFRKSPSWSRLVVKYFGEQALSVLGRARGQ